MKPTSKNLLLNDTNITTGFWADRQKLNRDVTIHSVYDRFKETGRFDAFKLDWKKGEPNRPHIFWDSDIAKWLESAAYIIAKTPDAELENIIDEVVDLIDKNRWDDGYFNICYTLFEPDDRFTARHNHELYCAGHLMEAAVAYYNATGKDKFLNIMCDYADMIEKSFVTEKWAEFDSPGHEEIELALVKLYRATGEKRYLNLSKHFVDERGKTEDEAYSQAHMPVREQEEAVGHSVRAVYLYCAMADLAAECDDDSLFTAADKLFDNMAKKKMYITGGLGQTCVGEAFLPEYDLPETSSYCETCADIGYILFASRMSAIKPHRKYDDAAELALYNGFLCGLSLDGKGFFYDNSIEVDLIGISNPKDNRHRPFYPITQRLEVFDCSCCPPNVTRLIASVGEIACSASDDTLWVHHFIGGDFEADGKKITVETLYPENGKIRITCSGNFRLALRLPAWCRSYTLNGGKNATLADDGFIYVDVADGDVIEYSLDMPVRFVQANPKVRQCCGRIAVQRGPLVYCAEGVDNPLPLKNLYVDTKAEGKLIKNDEFGFYGIELDGFIKPDSDELYYDYDENYVEQRIKLIPYYAYANRGETDMLIWLTRK
ncbi:MAG: glycoside hydrolase family 127 protein [Clostridia bacterium]|nr:glycoside hydrolase family 127 protein [Clostridia bacterium]